MPGLLDELRTSSTVATVSVLHRAAIRAGRHQAVRPWRLLTQENATTLDRRLTWRRKINRSNRRTARTV